MDRASRLMGGQLSEELGTPIKYVNRPGASGNIALTTFVEADTDGYTVFSGNISTLSMMYSQEAPGDPLADKLTWLGAYLIDPALLITASMEEPQFLEAFIEMAREKIVRVGVANWASVQTLALLQLRDQTKANFEIIPYSGFSGAAIDLIGGHIEAAIGNFSAVEHLRRDNNIRYLGILPTGHQAARPSMSSPRLSTSMSSRQPRSAPLVFTPN